MNEPPPTAEVTATIEDLGAAKLQPAEIARPPKPHAAWRRCLDTRLTDVETTDENYFAALASRRDDFLGLLAESCG